MKGSARAPADPDSDAESDDDGSVDSNGDAAEKEQKVFLPASIHGSVRHLRKLARNALIIVSDLGKPTFFITLTCNPNWPDIVSELLEGQTAFDRTDVTCRVFKHRLAAFLHNLRYGKYFGNKEKPKFLIHVIEYQHRGMPHAHIVVSFYDAPTSDANTEEELAAFIDMHITAEHMSQPETDEDLHYEQLITDHMTHHCAVASNGCKKKRL